MTGHKRSAHSAIPHTLSRMGEKQITTVDELVARPDQPLAELTTYYGDQYAEYLN